MLPAHSQGRKAIWTAVTPHTGKRRIDEAFPHELRANTNEQEMFIRLKNGATRETLQLEVADMQMSPAWISFTPPAAPLCAGLRPSMESLDRVLASV
jgi:hypothetical protein